MGELVEVASGGDAAAHGWLARVLHAADEGTEVRRSERCVEVAGALCRCWHCCKAYSCCSLTL